MKIMNVGAPLVFGYYFEKELFDLLESKIQDGLCQEVIKDNETYIYINIQYDSEIDYIIRAYLSKVEKVTLGNKYKYEVELDYHEIKDDKSFIMHTDDSKFYKCVLFASEVNSNMLQLQFKII